MTAQPAQPPAPIRDRLTPVLAALAAHLPEDRRAALAASARHVLACSEFAATVAERQTDRVAEWLAAGDLDRPHERTALAGRLQPPAGADEAAFMAWLRQARHREMFRIAWRDLLGLASLEETLRALTELAELLIGLALAQAEADLAEAHGVPRDAEGRPQRLVVFGMGKLGGGELNFSSDIDLIFAYPEAGRSDGPRPLEAEPWFTRLAQRLIRLLDTATADGRVFRVDMRLRPFGQSGALVTRFAALEAYYEAHGREWERYAWIKARPVAGDLAAGQALLQRLQGFVYRRYLDYGVIEGLREMKALIAREAARKGMADSLKLGPGGIREVEFSVQLFQLIHGGRDRRLRDPRLLPVLHYLGERGLLPDWAVAELDAAYRYLRDAENRLQMIRDQQTHRLPQDPLDRWRLATAMGHGGDWDAFLAELDGHRRRVAEHFERIFATPQTEHGPADAPLHALWAALAAGEADRDEALATLAAQGYDDPAEAWRLLTAFAGDRRVQALTAPARRRLDALMPLLLARVAQEGEAGQATATLGRLLDLLRAVMGRTTYLAMLAEQPMALSQLVRLCAASPWVAETLATHPLLLDELVNPATLYDPPGRDGLAAELAEAFRRIDPADEEQVVEALRHFKQAQVLRVAAADLVGALPVTRVSDHLTWIAEVILDKVRALAWQRLVARHGRPRCVEAGQARDVRFLVVGYGKLGGIEMGYGSDLDLVFLHDSAGTGQETDGPRPLDNGTFFARLAQRMVGLLTVTTLSGKLYEVDLRLRPSGSSGLLVSSLGAFARYQQEDAWVWEHQALVRARPVAGDAELAEAFRAVRRAVLTRPRDAAELRRAVRDMRHRMWQHTGADRAAGFDLKKSPGGITDIEFMVQYLVLAHAHAQPAIARWTDNVRILADLAAHGVLTAAEADGLREAYVRLRDAIHHLTLQGRPAVVHDQRFQAERQRVRAMWQRLLEAD